MASPLFADDLSSELPTEVEDSEEQWLFEDEVSEISEPNYLEQSPFFAMESFEESLDEVERVEKKSESKTNLIYGQFTRVVDAVGQKQKNNSAPLMKIYNDHKPATDSDIRMRNAAFEFESEEEKDAFPHVNKALRDQAVSTVGEMITSEITAFQAFKKGLDFSFDFSSLFQGDASKKTTKAKRKDPVKYGLVLRDVIPPSDNYAVAAMTTMDEEWEHAAKARAVWDIDTVESSGARTPLKVKIDDSHYDLHAEDRSYYYDEGDMPFNIVNATTRMKLPSSKLTGNVKPRDFKNAQSLSGGVVPPMQLTLRQEESLYSVNYLTTGNFEKEKITHVLRAPIYKRLSLKRILDEEFQAVETVYENLLVSESLPSLSVHYRNQKNQYLARFSYEKEQTEISVLAETPPDFDFGKDFGTKSGEKYKIDYKIRF